MRASWFSAIPFVLAVTQAAVAQEARPVFRDLAGSGPVSRPDSEPSLSTILGQPAQLPLAAGPDLRVTWEQSRGFDLELLQEEIAPRLRVGLSLYGRVDVPGDTSVTLDNVAYSDIFDIGYGVNGELSLLGEMTPRFYMGGYLSVGWDRFSGASNVDMNTGEFFSFDHQDVTTAIVGAKVLHRFGPGFFWEGRMGLGLVHYGSLSFTDVTTPIAVSGLQFFRPVTHGLFDIGGRVGFGNPRVTVDLGLDFRFMGSEAAGRDVDHVEVSPDFFFVFAIDLGMTLRF
jgi:hypothetical protein